MEPDSPLNRAIQEWSRRFLRGSKISLTAPVIHHERFTELHLMKNEAIPSVYSTFNILDNKESNLDLWEDGQLIGRIGTSPPSNEVVHVPTDNIETILSRLDETIQSLIQAGYPGCVGCGGQDALETWDESASRLRLSQ